MNLVVATGVIGSIKEINGRVGNHISLAVKDSWKDKAGQWQDKTTWVPLFTRFNYDHLMVGDRIAVTGKLSITPPQNGKSGFTAVNVDKIELIQRKSEKNRAYPEVDDAEFGAVENALEQTEGYIDSAEDNFNQVSDDVPF